MQRTRPRDSGQKEAGHKAWLQSPASTIDSLGRGTRHKVMQTSGCRALEACTQRNSEALIAQSLADRLHPVAGRGPTPWL